MISIIKDLASVYNALPSKKSKNKRINKGEEETN
jgi:hypothetical protein